ncbi:hypothetical protein GWI33_017516 [Rhynchophorus ferrugineus]|uniref:Secreted protein n=1 Tax=Rhynchophorus ferrugineus TaxID=354439 RepID=A0A834HVW6_RHYFE|nr:hypothetical protein GWI33_017516 [Rhynchophorus ferrugineus]
MILNLFFCIANTLTVICSREDGGGVSEELRGIRVAPPVGTVEETEANGARSTIGRVEHQRTLPESPVAVRNLPKSSVSRWGCHVVVLMGVCVRVGGSRRPARQRDTEQ